MKKTIIPPSKLERETMDSLLGLSIIEVGADYIKLNSGLCIFLDEKTIDQLNVILSADTY